MKNQLKELAITLYDIDAIKFGDFITKVGLKTPIYFDLRIMISYPKVMSRLAKALLQFANDCDNINHLCGVPYTALPLATLMSVESNIPMLIKRKEAKEYGTKKLIEGNYNPGDHCVIIEDVVTSGSSILETVRALKDEGLKVTETFVILNRQQGGEENLQNNGIKMNSLYNITELMEYLVEAKKISSETMKNVTEYVKSCQAPIIPVEETLNKRLSLPFSTRADLAKNEIASKLLQLMEKKQSTLCLAADLNTTDSILNLAELVGPHIIVLKTHIDIVEDFNEEFIKKLKELAKKHEFLLMEDRKFGDIGNTVSLQYRKGIYKIAEWADLITVHPVAGSSIIDGLQNGLKGINEARGIFLVAQMSSKNALTTGDYLKNAAAMVKESNMIVGLVCQSDIISDPGLLQLTPGVKLTKSCDTLGQQYNTPETVVNSGADLAVVGRAIIEATDQLSSTLQYKKQLWSAYKKRIM